MRMRKKLKEEAELVKRMTRREITRENIKVKKTRRNGMEKKIIRRRKDSILSVKKRKSTTSD